VVVPVPPQRIEALLDRVDGLCLSGGPDIHPSAYSRAAHPDLGPTEPRLDEFELQLARAADRRGMPILGICRGAQLLNVARSGTLHQHLPEIVGTTIAHRQPEDAVIPTHTVDVAPHTLLAGIAGSVLPVNSSHHQAVDELGAGLVPVAWAPDGTIEAIEATDRAFVLGVQWHAECLTDRPEEAAIFSAFADACEAEALPMLQTATG
jgi:putative glutamine amidotransferase